MASHWMLSLTVVAVILVVGFAKAPYRHHLVVRVKASTGSKVTLQCATVIPVDCSKKDFSWMRHWKKDVDKIIVVANGTVEHRKDTRFGVDQTRLSRGDVSLTIANVTRNDTGVYTCGNLLSDPRRRCGDNTTVTYFLKVKGKRRSRKPITAGSTSRTRRPSIPSSVRSETRDFKPTTAAFTDFEYSGQGADISETVATTSEIEEEFILVKESTVTVAKSTTDIVAESTTDIVAEFTTAESGNTTVTNTKATNFLQKLWKIVPPYVILILLLISVIVNFILVLHIAWLKYREVDEDEYGDTISSSFYQFKLPRSFAEHVHDPEDLEMHGKHVFI